MKWRKLITFGLLMVLFFPLEAHWLVKVIVVIVIWVISLVVEQGVYDCSIKIGRRKR